MAIKFTANKPGRFSAKLSGDIIKTNSIKSNSIKFLIRVLLFNRLFIFISGDIIIFLNV
uniref:Uncharacterized protein n=1 Tax=Yersinia enterocolitica W22703 TaxID=913028 RepID=F4N765_YEREN|nr:unknown protein [Yersinia enterocolitica W22703]